MVTLTEIDLTDLENCSIKELKDKNLQLLDLFRQAVDDCDVSLMMMLNSASLLVINRMIELKETEE